MKRIKSVFVLLLASMVLCQANGLLLFHHTCKMAEADCKTSCTISLEKSCCAAKQSACCENEVAFFKSDSKFTHSDSKSIFTSHAILDAFILNNFFERQIEFISSNCPIKKNQFRHYNLLSLYLPFLCQWRC
ncbi:MAG: hypothetical protein IPK03_00180 [Bacteroidetes bacterium]|nr:hypothetical protein [Bacteroidota bacterium]